MIENKTYYKSIFAKIKNKNSIISLSFRISYKNDILKKKEFKIISRLYKINNTNDISFDYVYKILKKKFNQDIVNTISLFYLRDSISFKSMKVKNNSNTVQINICVNYSEKINKYKSTIDYKDSMLLEDFETIKYLVNIISERYENFINNYKIFDIDDIFIINNYDMIDFFVDYKIINSYKRYGTVGWGIEYNIKTF